MKNNRVPVDIEKLSHGLKTTFLGVSEVFDSIGAEETPGFGVVEEAPAEPVKEAADKTDETVQAAKTVETESEPDKTEDGTMAEPADAVSAEAPTEEPVDKVASSITIDDLIKVASKKIQKKGNSEKIAALVKSYGKATLKEIPPEKFEAFMTDLAAI